MPNTSNDYIKELLAVEEGQTFECKRAAKKPAEVLHVICAFANADGGIFVYGLEDPQKASGLDRLKGLSEATNNGDELLKLIANNFVPPLPGIKHHYIDIVNTAGVKDHLLVISVDSSGTVHSLHSGQTYLRRGSQNNLLTHEQSMQLQYEKGSVSFESELAKNISIENLDHRRIEEYIRFNRSEETDSLRFFINNGLAEEKKDGIYLNNAAVLLFAANPFVMLKRKCGITITHYFGIRKTPSAKPNFRRPPFTIEGALLSQIVEAYRYISENALPLKLEGAHSSD